VIKLLIVDDSALMRRQLSSLFDAEPDFEIKLARNGREAVQENRNFMPDVITLDINMPEMDGLTALSMIMSDRPVPVVMISSLTEKGALATFEALNLGAVDYVVKPGGTISLSIESIRATVINKVRMAVKAKIKPPRNSVLPRVKKIEVKPETFIFKPVASTSKKEGVVVIGVSTGGPRTLEIILPLLPRNFQWPILVAQHMPATFTNSFAQRMDGMCEMNVTEANRPMDLNPGTIYIAKGGADLQVVKRSDKLVMIAKPENSNFLWHPSVEILGRSVIEHFPPSNILGVMLTGMGNDGAESFTAIKKNGGRTIAESEESAVVFGMPSELIRQGGASIVLPAEKIAAQMIAWSGQ
jgi:two-component system chemotaxis response regulator CheB